MTGGPRAAAGPLVNICPSGFADESGAFPQLYESGLHDSWADARGGVGRGGQLWGQASQRGTSSITHAASSENIL